ncbi:hypothetical protein E4U58_002629 [Claviceps cyperi]|nr:hypothetical protein E4U58_002629 [Claviceps cyperi]
MNPKPTQTAASVTMAPQWLTPVTLLSIGYCTHDSGENLLRGLPSDEAVVSLSPQIPPTKLLQNACESLQDEMDHGQHKTTTDLGSKYSVLQNYSASASAALKPYVENAPSAADYLPIPSRLSETQFRHDWPLLPSRQRGTAGTINRALRDIVDGYLHNFVMLGKIRLIFAADECWA